MIKKEYSIDLEKILKQYHNREERIIIKHSYTEFLLFIIKFWEDGVLIAPGANSIESLGEYINKHFDIRRLRNPDTEISINTLLANLYALRDLSKK